MDVGSKKPASGPKALLTAVFELFSLRKVDTCLPPRPALVPMAIEMSPNAGAHSEARMVAYILAGNSWLHAGL